MFYSLNPWPLGCGPGELLTYLKNINEVRMQISLLYHNDRI